MIGAECDVDALPSQGRDIGMQGIALGRADPQCLQPVFVDIAPGGGEIDRADGDIAVQQRLDALPVAVVIEVLEAHGRGVLQHQQQEASSSREYRVNKARAEWRHGQQGQRRSNLYFLNMPILMATFSWS
jgi:hypothetical protein